MRMVEGFPSYPKHPRAGGSHEGLMPANVHGYIFALCNTREGINADMYVKLQTEIDLEGLLDLLEMQHARGSWLHADMFNSDEFTDIRREGGY